MGRNADQFISPVEAAKLIERTPEDVINLCNEGLIRRKSTGQRILVRRGDVEEVRETNLHSVVRPKGIVSRLLMLERKVKALTNALDLLGAVNGMTSNSLDELDQQDLLALAEMAKKALLKEKWDTEEMLRFSEVFLRMSDSDIIRLNDSLGTHDSWRVFYELCLHMSIYAREADLEPGRDTDTVRALLQKGLRNLRSIGVLFIENAAYLKSSDELLRSTMSHDLAQFDTLIRQLNRDGYKRKTKSRAP